MKSVLNIGDAVEYRMVVQPGDLAAFHNAVIHPVCATFALARDIEWTSRQFVFQVCDPDEEGVGTTLIIHHKSPAFVGEEVVIKAQVQAIHGNELTCSYQAIVGSRLIASGTTGQKILKRVTLNKLFRVTA